MSTDILTVPVDAEVNNGKSEESDMEVNGCDSEPVKLIPETLTENNEGSVPEPESRNGGIEDEETKRSLPSVTPDDIFTVISDDKRVRKRDNVDTAEICPNTKRIKLLTNKTSLKKNNGYNDGGSSYLFPEEALYNLEIHKIELLLHKVPVSVQRARSLLLNPAVDKDVQLFDGSTCGVDEYTVFKYLAKEGYRLRRPKKIVTKLTRGADAKISPSTVLNIIPQKTNGCSSEPTTIDVDVVMESDCQQIEVPAEERGSSVRKVSPGPISPGIAVKRDHSSTDVDIIGSPKRLKLEEAAAAKDSNVQNTSGVTNGGGEERESSSSPDIICDYQSPCVGMVGAEVTFADDAEEEEGNDEIMVDTSQDDVIEIGDSDSSISDDAEPMPSTSKGPEPYTVSEVDSDIEFIDEVIITHPGVDIEELRGDSADESLPDEDAEDFSESDLSQDGSMEATDNTSIVRETTKEKGFNGRVQDIVDLVSSDEDESQGADKLPSEKVKEFSESIWSKLVPNTTAVFKIPPTELLPKDIGQADASSTYSSPNTKEGEESLEEIVDNLNIAEECEMEDNDKFVPKDWQDWRTHLKKTAADVFKTSLLGEAFIAEGDQWKDEKPSEFAQSSLNLWPEANGSTDADVEIIEDGNQGSEFENYHRFDLYPPSDKKAGKAKLGVEVQSAFRVLIARSTAPVVQNLHSLARQEDNTPVLVAVVDEDQAVTFISLGSTGASNLFDNSTV